MKSKKLISFLCAAALTASSFAGLAVTASAAGETTLWSDSFDGYSTLETDTYGDWLKDVLVKGFQNQNGTYKGIDDIVLSVGGGEGGDDSQYWCLPSEENDYYLKTSTGRFTNVGRGSKLTFNTAQTADATKDIVLDFDLMHGAARETITESDQAFAIMGKAGTTDTYTIVTLNDITDDVWTDVRVVVDTTGTKVYVGDSTTAVATSAATTITGLDFSAYKNGVGLDSKTSNHRMSDGKGPGFPTWSLDDMVLYSAAAGGGLASTAPQAQSHGGAVVEYKYAPKGSAPARIQDYTLGLLAEDTLDDKTTGRLIYIGTDSEAVYTDLNAVNLRIGPAADAQGNTNWQIIKNDEADPKVTDNVLYAPNGARSTANRGAKMEFKRDGEVLTVAEREVVVAQFAAKLVTGDKGPAELIFSGDLTAGSRGIASPLAMITTDATAESGVYAVDNALTKVADGGKNVIEVNDNEWVFIKITAYRSEGKQAGAKIAVTRNYGDEEKEETTYIFGEAGTGSTGYADIQNYQKSGVSNLPYITFRSGDDTVYGVSNSKNYIDNIQVYSSTVDPDAEPTPTPVPKHDVTITNEGQEVSIATEESKAFDGVLIHAKYDGAALKSVKSYDIKGISSAAAKTQTVTDTVNQGDKFFVWNSLAGQVPYGSADATGLVAPVSKKITFTGSDFTVKKGENAIQSGAELAAGDVITIEATDEANEIKSIISTPPLTVTGGKVTYTVPAEPVDVSIRAVEVGAKTVTPTAKKLTISATNTTEFEVTPAANETITDNSTIVVSPKDDDSKVTAVTATGATFVADASAGTATATITTAADVDIQTVTVVKNQHTVSLKDGSDAAVRIAKGSAAGAATPIEDAVKGDTIKVSLDADATNKAITAVSYKEAGDENGTPVVADGNGEYVITVGKKNIEITVAVATSYSITYNLDGGANAQNAPTTYVAGTGVETLPTPTKENYDFDGWYTEAGFENKVTSIGTDKAEAITLYAKWTAKEYTITYVLQGGDWAASYTAPAKYTYGTGATLPVAANVTKQYKEFGGWYAADDFTGDAVTTIADDATGVKTFYAKWNDITYTVEDGSGDDATVTITNATGVVGDEVEITVVAVGNKAVSKVEIKKDTDVLAEATKGANNKYTFTLNDTTLKGQTVTVVPTVITAADSVNDAVDHVVVSPATATVTQGTNNTAFSAEVQNATNAPFVSGAKSEVEWSVAATDPAKTKKSDTTISETGVLTVAADEEEALTVTATSKSDGTKVGTAAVTVKQRVAENATVLTLQKTNGDKIADASVVATPGDYTLSAVTPGVLKLTGETDENGQVELLLNPNRKYTIVATLEGETLKTVENFTTESEKAIEIPSVTVAADASDAVKTLLANKVPGETATVTAEDGKTFYSVEVKDNSTNKAAVTTDPTGADIVGKKSVSFKVPDEGISAINIVYQEASSIASIAQLTITEWEKDLNELGTVTYVAPDASNGIKASGTVNYTTFPKFSSDEELKKGHYIAFKITLPTIEGYDYAGAYVKVKSDATGAVESNSTGFTSSDLEAPVIMYLYDTATKYTVKVDLDGDGTKYTEETYEITWDKVTDEAAEGKLYVAPQKFTVTNSNSTPVNGNSLAIDKESAAEDAAVTITPTIAAGYHLKSLIVKNAEDKTIYALEADANATPAVKEFTTATVSDNTTYTFTMPAGDVSVTAEFYQPEVTVDVAATYVDGGNADTDYRTAEQFIASNGTINDEGALSSAKFVILSFDVSDYIGKISNAALNFKVASSAYNSYLGLGEFEKYIDLADKTNVPTVSYSNIATLGGTASYLLKPVNWNADADSSIYSTTKNTINEASVDITRYVRSDADGQITYIIMTGTGREQKLYDFSLDLTVAPSDITPASIKVQQVYEDTEGTITIGDKSYSALNTTTVAGTWAAGDVYNIVPKVGTDVSGISTFLFKTPIDDGTSTAKYTYTSNVTEATTLVGGENIINLIYDKADYQNVTFTAKVGDTAQAGASIKVNGTTADGTTITEIPLTTGDGNNDTVLGVVSTKLLPGEYNYTVAKSDTYIAKSATEFTVANAAKNVDVPLTARAATTIDITSPASIVGAVGDTLNYSAVVKDQSDDAIVGASVEWKVGTLDGEDFTADETHFSTTAAGAVTVNDEATAGDYKVQAKSGSAVAYADLTVTADQQYNLTLGAVQVDGRDAGTVSVLIDGVATDARKFVENTSITLKAVPKNGYTFAGWATTDDANEYIDGAGAEYAVTMDAAKTYYAYFTFNGVFVDTDFNSETTTSSPETVAFKSGSNATFANMAWSTTTYGAFYKETIVTSNGNRTPAPHPAGLTAKDGNYLWLYQNGTKNASATGVIEGGIQSKGTIEFDMVLPMNTHDNTYETNYASGASNNQSKYRPNDDQTLTISDGTNAVAILSIVTADGVGHGGGGNNSVSSRIMKITVGNGANSKDLTIESDKWMHVKIEYDNKVSTITITPDDTEIAAVSGTYTSDAETISDINTIAWTTTNNTYWASIAIDNLKVKETITPAVVD